MKEALSTNGYSLFSVMKFVAIIGCLLVLAFAPAKIQAQPNVAYITPDAGAPGMTVAVEMISAEGNTQSFGADGVYEPEDIVRLVNVSDHAYVKLGPCIISWNGRMIQQMIMIEPNAPAPKAIPLEVVVSGNTSTGITFNIVQPVDLGVYKFSQAIGALSRTAANTLVVDSLIMQGGANFTCPFNDPDVTTPGNQSYLPLRILSVGPIRISANLSANGQNGVTGTAGGHGGPGGGGGGSGYPGAGGAGYTGGGGDNDNTAGPGGDGSGNTGGVVNGGQSLNNTPGGFGMQHTGSGGDDGGGGGTGHPFGASGFTGSGNASQAGGYGAGTGGGSSGKPFYTNNYGGGGGGYATAGTAGSGTGDNHGLVNGNAMLEPLAGGSAGGAGNVTYSTFLGGGASGGSGGGGGGAIELTSFTIFDDPQGFITARGGNGSNGVPQSGESAAGGGGGSGGAVSIGARDSIVFGTNSSIDVSGGSGGSGSPSSNGGSGGVGRVRLDGYVSKISTGANYFNATKDYAGPSIQKAVFTKDSVLVTGHGLFWDAVPANTARITLRWMWPSVGVWKTMDGGALLNDPSSHTAKWAATIPRAKGSADTELYVVALQNESPVIDPYACVPTALMSHTSGMIAQSPRLPKVLAKTDTIDFGKVLVGSCSNDTTFKIYSVGRADLSVTGFSITGADQIDFNRKTNPQVVKVGDSLAITLSFCPILLKCPMHAVLHVFTNDTEVVVYLVGCAVQPLASIAPDTIDFGTVKKGDCKDTVIVVTNRGTGPLTITNEVVPNPPFVVLDVLPKTVQENDSLSLKVRFCAQDTLFVIHPDSIFSNNPSSLVVMLEGNAPVKHGILSMPAVLNFGAVHKGDCKDSGFFAYNVGDDTLHVTTPIVSGANFTLLTPTGAFSIAPKDSMFVKVRYCATDSGSWQGLTTLNSGNTTLLAFTGMGVLQIPSVIDFGLVAIGSCKDSSVTVTNTGTDTLLLVGSITFIPPFYYQSPDPISIPPGQSKIISLRFCPTDTAIISDTARLIPVYAGNSPQFVVKGGGLTTTLSITGSPVDFGCLRVSEVGARTILLRNTGAATLHFKGGGLSGIGKNVTLIRMPVDSILPGGVDSIIFEASSSTPDTVFGVFSIEYYEAPYSRITIVGRVRLAPTITSLDTLVNFGTLNVGDTSVDTCIRVTNYSCVAVAAGNVIIHGAGGTSFQITSGAVPLLADSAVARVCIRFIPTQGGAQTATILSVNNGDTVQVATVTGIGKGTAVGVQLVIDTVGGRPGQIVNAPVHTLNDITAAAITSVTFRVQFDPMQLDLKPPVAGTTSSIAKADGSNAPPTYTLKKYSYGDWEITAAFGSPLTGKPVIAELPFEILLPTANTAPVHLLSASFGTSPATLALAGSGEVVIQQCDTTERFATPPSSIAVSQNTPNPFNPRTAIQLYVRTPGHVRIDVMNVLGETVMVPLDENLGLGEHTVEIDGSGLASGVYRYITTWTGTEASVRDSKTMIVVK